MIVKRRSVILVLNKSLCIEYFWLLFVFHETDLSGMGLKLKFLTGILSKNRDKLPGALKQS